MKKLIQRIMLWLGSWPKDKVLHFTICLIISLLAGCIARICGAEWTGVMAAAWFAGFFAGVFKEVWDDIESQGSEESDWAADIVGTTLGAIIVTILML
mgnify:FL=1|jgi:VanZ family protein